MKAFMDKEFMLQSPVAQHLYHTYAADMPICDYHCHISPKEIYENRRFENIAGRPPARWLSGRRPLQVARDAFQRRARGVHHRHQARP